MSDEWPVRTFASLSAYVGPCAGMFMASYRERLGQELEDCRKFREALLADVYPYVSKDFLV